MDASLRPAPGADPEPLFSARPFSAPYAAPDEEIASLLFAQAARPEAAEARIDRTATGLIEAIRGRSGGLGGIEDFLHRYSLSTQAALSLLGPSEALLPVPDTAPTARPISGNRPTAAWLT